MTNRRGKNRSGSDFSRNAALGAALFALVAFGSTAAIAIASAPSITSTSFSSVSTTSVVLEAELTTGEKATKYHFEYDTAPYPEGGPAHGTSTPVGKLTAGESPAKVKATVEGLSPGTAYHFRVVVENGEGKKASPDRAFATYPTPLGTLPDGRTYEQASPVDKNGGDVTGTVPSVKAAIGGGRITFGSTSGVPGGEGAQQLPLYLATRTGEGQAGSWGTQGLLPPASFGAKARVLGWTPDFSDVFEQVTQFGSLTEKGSALFARPGGTGAPVQITPYVDTELFAYPGSSTDSSVAVFESTSGQLGTTPAGSEGRSNVYAWDGSKVSLASVFNDGEAAKGAFAGPYDWVREKTTEGAAARHYYTQDERAVTEDGSVFFTTRGSGHIYLRQHPSMPQSEMEGERCTKAADACTIDVSPSVRTPPDLGGERPRAFQAASADGQSAFFTSPEKLTDDANTGPEVEAPKVGRATIGAAPEEEAEEVMEEFLTAHHAVGITVQGEYIYWADTARGSIGRAHLVGEVVTDPNDDYVSREEIEVQREPEPELEPGHEEGFAAPRYVAVDSEYIYWTNATDEKVGEGSIGRAELGVEEAKAAEPEFITGASNPQGVAVNASHIYWANSRYAEPEIEQDIARAAIDGSEAEQRFFKLSNTEVPYGVALDGTHVYFATEGVASGSGSAFVRRIPLEGGDKEVIGLFGGNPRGVAVDANHLYWVAQEDKAIGRVPLAAFQPEYRICVSEVPDCETEFLKVSGSPTGLALASSHLYWSNNGEILPHQGNDLYRYSVASKALTDLTPDSSDENGAEVQGVLGASKDGSRLYFVANGVLAGGRNANEEEALPGTCNGLAGVNPSGSCNLYLWEAGGSAAGSISFVAKLDSGGNYPLSDARDWLPSDAAGVFVVGVARSSALSSDGGTLLFASQRKLTAYDNQGIPELYRYQVGGAVTCVSCNPTGAAPGHRASLGSIQPSTLELGSTMAVSSHNLADGGQRVFFETVDALVPEDTNGANGCEAVGSERQQGAGFFSCLDVYEWEAPETGSCKAGGPSYSPSNGGCIYLISTGKSNWASLFGDASENGNDVFFFTRQGLVGQDKDELLDVYDARVGSGLPSQSPAAAPACESPEACHGAPPSPPAEEAVGSATFVGPTDPKPKRAKAKKKQHKQKKHHAKKKQHANKRGGSR